MTCEWEKFDLGGEAAHRCTNPGCGATVINRGDESDEVVLSKMPPCGERGGLLDKAKRYGLAVARWMEAGRPERGEGEVRRIFAELCEPCERFDPRKGTCMACGCKVRRSGAALLNKIRMKTETCPGGKW